MIKAMTERADELGVEILLETPVKSLIKEDGEIIDVVANDKEGDLEVYAGAVIISTGGFGDSPEFIKKHAPYEWGKDIFSYRIPGLTGDGIQMAWDAGAAYVILIMYSYMYTRFLKYLFFFINFFHKLY